MRHTGIDWHKTYLKVGEITAVYPPSHRGKPYVGRVQRIKKNRYGRVSYVINDKDVFTEELFPGEGQNKLRINYREWINSI
jgi:hypothetical protein